MYEWAVFLIFSDMANQLPKVGCYDFLVEPFHCDFAKRLFMGHLGNYLLNVSDIHSNDRGWGINYLNSINKTWVLSRLTIDMSAYPLVYDTIKVETWLEKVISFFTERNFKITNKQDKVLGYGKSVWAIIDMTTRQPIKLQDVNNGLISTFIAQDTECRIDKLSRVQMSDAAILVKTIDTHYSDVDINGHINSIKYIEHVLDLWTIDWYQQHTIQRIDVAYVAEAHQGDKLNFYREPITTATGQELYHIRITKTNRHKAETEVCRCAVTFRYTTL